MKKEIQNLLILLIAFVSIFFVSCKKSEVSKAIINQSPSPAVIETARTPDESIKTETSEEKAVRLAEEFIARNGYTDAPADKNNLSHETVEFYRNTEELLKSRHNTLEPKAYGVYHHGRGNEKGWTVVFRYSGKVIAEIEKLTNSALKGNPTLSGRAVTMNENFENLLVEHKDYGLGYAEKKLQ
jgi:hypothetical protein